MENNKLIAEFMGIKLTENGLAWDYINNPIPSYHTSWDELMPVVEKINDTERYEVCIGDSHCHITDIENDNYKVRALTLSLQGKTTIEATHLAVVEFIKWYNDGEQ